MKDEYLALLKRNIGEDASILSTLVGGMMNEAYIVKSSKGKFVYYISTPQANEMVDRKLEKYTQNIAYNLGLTSENVYFDLEKGIKINRFIEGDSLNHIENFDYGKVADLMVKYHSSKETSNVYYNPLGRLESYKKEASEFVSDFEPDFKALLKVIEDNKEFLLSQEKTLAHNDAQRSNIVLGSDGKYSLIDYEFAADNDPVYDIATFGNDNVLEGKKLLDEYLKRVPLKNALKRYALWRIDVSLQWHLVAIIKHYRGEGKVHGFNFLAVAEHFLNNAKEAYKLLK